MLFAVWIMAVARQATEAALRDADVRERDISTVKRRLEAELAALRGETVDAVRVSCGHVCACVSQLPSRACLH